MYYFDSTVADADEAAAAETLRMVMDVVVVVVELDSICRMDCLRFDC